MIRLATVLVAALVGATTGTAGVVLHQAWWWLAALLVAAIAVVSWLTRRETRVALALASGAVVLRAAVPRAEGDYLVAADGPGWTLLAGSLVVLILALVLPDRAEDQGRDHLPT